MSQLQRSSIRRAQPLRTSTLQPGAFFSPPQFQIKDSHFYDATQNVHYYDRKGETSESRLSVFVLKVAGLTGRAWASTTIRFGRSTSRFQRTFSTHVPSQYPSRGLEDYHGLG